jgi:hypothetical protein
MNVPLYDVRSAPWTLDIDSCELPAIVFCFHLAIFLKRQPVVFVCGFMATTTATEPKTTAVLAGSRPGWFVHAKKS